MENCLDNWFLLVCHVNSYLLEFKQVGKVLKSVQITSFYQFAKSIPTCQNSSMQEKYGKVSKKLVSTSLPCQFLPARIQASRKSIAKFLGNQFLLVCHVNTYLLEFQQVGKVQQSFQETSFYQFAKSIPTCQNSSKQEKYGKVSR